MFELEIYAAGLRQGDLAITLGQHLETYSGVRYKVDTNHDIVYFEIEKNCEITLHDILKGFSQLNLNPRVVGALPEGLRIGSKTTRLL